ncbi:hypothetical protein V5799_014415 [Amblyomma americanum]|uniref:Uncharacterized protein n=1 Tax=Amblyomma americanum TaxID=6943 RepID=A0AAQ4E335_AMBAM
MALNAAAWAVICFAAALVTLLPCGYASGTPGLQNCTSDTDCSGGQRCVTHYNFSVVANCESYNYCIDVSETSCSCSPGYTCRLKDCPSSPYECLLVEDTKCRCGAVNAPVCAEDETCTYIFQNIFCYKCPCYGSFNVTCLKSEQYPSCGANSIALIFNGNYTCDGCRSGSAVLVAHD